MGGLRRSRDIDGFDVRVLEQLAVVGNRTLRPGRLGDIGEPLGADLGEMQALGQRMGGASLGADAAAPAGADDRYAYLLHETLQGAAASSYYRLILSKRAAVSPMIFCLSAEESRGTLLIRPTGSSSPMSKG